MEAEEKSHPIQGWVLFLSFHYECVFLLSENWNGEGAQTLGTLTNFSAESLLMDISWGWGGVWVPPGSKSVFLAPHPP